MRSGLIFVSCVIAATGLMGCGRTVNRTAERKIRDALPEYIGQAAEWRAHVDNPPERTLSGKLRTVTIDGDGVDLKKIVRLASLHIEMRDTDVDTGHQQLKSVGLTTFRAVITEPDLNDYVRRNPPPPEEPVRIKSLRLLNGKIHAEATRWALGREWAFSSDAEPQLVSTSQLYFDPERMSIVGVTVPLPASALRWLARRLSDGMDFSAFPFPVQILRFKVEPGRLIIEGHADVIKSLNEKIGAIWNGNSLSEANSASQRAAIETE